MLISRIVFARHCPVFTLLMLLKIPGKILELRAQIWNAGGSYVLFYYATSAPLTEWLHDVESCGAQQSRACWMNASSGVDYNLVNRSELDFQTRVILLLLSSQSAQCTYNMMVLIWQRMLNVKTSTALILFQRGARIRSLGQNAVGCLRCGDHRVCQQNQHSCEIRVQGHYKETTSHFQHKITNCHGTHYERDTQWENKTKRFVIIFNTELEKVKSGCTLSAGQLVEACCLLFDMRFICVWWWTRWLLLLPFLCHQKWNEQLWKWKWKIESPDLSCKVTVVSLAVV